MLVRRATTRYKQVQAYLGDRLDTPDTIGLDFGRVVVDDAWLVQLWRRGTLHEATEEGRVHLEDARMNLELLTKDIDAGVGFVA